VVLNRAVPVADPYPVEGHEQDRSWLSAVTSPAPGRAVLKLGSVVNGHSITQVTHAETRLTVDVGTSTASFIAAYENAVPVMPADAVDALIARRASWQEMLDLVDASAPHGFLIYSRTEIQPVMSLAGHPRACVAYLMGNHTIAERMYRHDPTVMLYAPLRTLIWEHPDGNGRFTFDQPSAQFHSFGDADIATVGVELDRKIAALLDHLGVDVPEPLRGS